MYLVIRVGRELFRFASLRDWKSHAASRFYAAGVTLRDVILVDATGRPCPTGRDFARADLRGAFPVIAYTIKGSVEAVADGDSQADTDEWPVLADSTPDTFVRSGAFRGPKT